jgi:hypothetical protein
VAGSLIINLLLHAATPRSFCSRSRPRTIFRRDFSAEKKAKVGSFLN